MAEAELESAPKLGRRRARDLDPRDR